MTSVRVGDELALKGPPSNVRAVVALDVENAEAIPLALNIAGKVTIYSAVLRPVAGGTCEIRLRLPDAIAPGTYSGEATVNGKPRAVRVEIEPQLRIRLQPAQTMLTMEAASSKPFALTLFNGGNVAIDVPKAVTLDLDDADGQDRALGRSLRATIARGEQRMERFFEELRLVHGGEARVTIRSGAGPLRPGEARELACVLDVPDTVSAGRSYTGSWDLGPASHVIVADIMISSRPNPVRPTT